MNGKGRFFLLSLLPSLVVLGVMIVILALWAGPTGPPGATGLQGATGSPGATGLQGATGPPGQALRPASVTGWEWRGDWPFEPSLPDHQWIDLGNGELLFLHFDTPVTEPDEPGATLLYIGEGRKGRFYAEEQPHQGETGFTHYHRFLAPTVDAGHGGPPGAEGYWLRHSAVASFEMPWGTVEPGVDFQFMPTTPPTAGTIPAGLSLPASATAWKWVNDWPFDPPLPDHLWLDTGEGRLLFLHYDKPVDQPGAKLLYVGDAVRGRFCAAEQPHQGETGFTHYHRLVAPTVDAGHGGPPGAEGYWLRHIAVASFEMPWGTVEPGVDFNFMPTVPPQCQ